MVKNILVTGCAGFIGYNLSNKLLSCDFNVFGIDSLNDAYDKEFKKLRLDELSEKKNFQFRHADLSSKDALENINDIDVVFHMGARAGVRQSFKDPLSYIKDNTIATTIGEIKLKMLRMILIKSQRKLGLQVFEQKPKQYIDPLLQPISKLQ